MTMQVYLTALGCRLNEAELQTWANSFRQQGLVITNQLVDANLIIINTCAVTNEAARKSRQTIRKLHRKNPSAKLIVTGCYASLEKEQAEQLLGVDLIVSNENKNQLPKLAKELLEWQSMPYAASEPNEASLFVRNKERAFIKIQDGCRYRCTYCIVTLARGDEKSRTRDELIKEIDELQQSGVNEVVLTGVHVGGYGSDLDSTLYQLVVAILEQTSMPRIRFASVEPWDLPGNFFDLFQNKRLMPHMHLPIQSGSNKILKKMSRRCKTETFLKLIKKARSVVPSFNITSDIIVGFPSENEEDFELSKKIIKQAEFGHTHIFSYSKREGTKAARLPQQIDSIIKKSRSQALHEVASGIKTKSLLSMIGTIQNVLWEGVSKKTDAGLYRLFGYTENYHKIYFEHDEMFDLSNQILTCKVSGFDDLNSCLVAQLLKPIDQLSRQLSVKLL